MELEDTLRRQNPLEWLSNAMMAFTAIPILAMMLHVTADILSKYIFRTPIPGTLEIVSYYYMVAVVLLPTALVEMLRQSIAVDMFYQMMPRFMQNTCMFFVLVICSVTYGMFAYITLPDAVRAFRINELVMGPVNVVIWPARFVLPFTMAITSLVCVWLLYKFLTDTETRETLVNVDLPVVEPEVN